MQAENDDDLDGRSKVIRGQMGKHVPWLSYLVKRIADAS